MIVLQALWTSHLYPYFFVVFHDNIDGNKGSSQGNEQRNKDCLLLHYAKTRWQSKAYTYPLNLSQQDMVLEPLWQ